MFNRVQVVSGFHAIKINIIIPHVQIPNHVPVSKETRYDFPFWIFQISFLESKGAYFMTENDRKLVLMPTGKWILLKLMTKTCRLDSCAINFDDDLLIYFVNRNNLQLAKPGSPNCRSAQSKSDSVAVD